MIEKTILSNLIYNDEFTRKALPFLEPEYFTDIVVRKIYNIINDFHLKYNQCPTKEALLVELDDSSGLSDDQVEQAKQVISDFEEPTEEIREWVLDKTEKFCQEKAVYNAIMDSIQIMDGKTSQDKGAIPELLSNALAVTFDNNIGHDFIDDADSRFEFYKKKEEKIPFDLDYLNRVTKGGLSRKTLNIALAGTGVGKSLFMCHCAAGNLLQGYNVLYITLEMAEEKIAERIDANLLNTALDELKMLPKEAYDKKLERVSKKTDGKLIKKSIDSMSQAVLEYKNLVKIKGLLE